MEPLATGELDGRSFSCLPGCGFCCTFQPEASQKELTRLRARLAPRALPVVVGDGRSYLALQNKCGACTLLARRECQAYDLRPQHCRYFPFHVHFGERAQVYVNETCRGVVRAPGVGLHPQFAEAVLAHAHADEMRRHAEAARAAYAEFQRRARRAGVWADARAVAAEPLADLALTRAWLERALARAGEEITPDEMVADALAPFSSPDVTKRPFYLAPDLRWLTFDGPTRLLEMEEDGSLRFLRELPRVEGWRDPQAPLVEYVRELAARDLFVGSVYAVVDDLAYETSVEEAVWWRLAEIVADVAVRARVLRGVGVSDAHLPGEVVRFYDSTFLDAPTIGGFL